MCLFQENVETQTFRACYRTSAPKSVGKKVKVAQRGNRGLAPLNPNLIASLK